jgi:hypothetical protein
LLSCKQFYREVIAKLQFCNYNRYNLHVSQPANRRFVGEKLHSQLRRTKVRTNRVLQLALEINFALKKP